MSTREERTQRGAGGLLWVQLQKPTEQDPKRRSLKTGLCVLAVRLMRYNKGHPPVRSFSGSAKQCQSLPASR